MKKMRVAIVGYGGIANFHVEQLRRFPNLGRSVVQAPEAEVVRDMVFGSYVVRYSVHTDAVVILRIWHHYEGRAPSS